MPDDLLLYSLSALHHPIMGALEIVRPRSIVEVGSEEGGSTRDLALWAEANDAILHSIDPSPRAGVRDLAQAHSVLTLVEALSPDALHTIPAADAYILDGDHNYHVVQGEMHAIAARCESDWPLVMAQDVQWPSGRRDQYYDPTGLPAEAVHPHTWDKGVVPGNPGVERSGMRGAGQYAVAMHEGGERNGVMTAIEDFLAGRDDLRMAVVPAIFGLAFIYSATAPYAEELARFLAPYDNNPLISLLEQNRLRLYSTVIALQDVISTSRLDTDRTCRDLEAVITGLENDRMVVEERLAQSQNEARRLASELSNLRSVPLKEGSVGGRH